MIERLAPRLEIELLFAVRCFAVIRLAFMAVALVAHETVHPETIPPDRFTVVLALGTLYALVLVVLAVRGPGPLLAWQRLGVVDLAFVAALVVYTGGPNSPLRFTYFAIPFLVAFVTRPSRVALWSLATIACYVTICWLLELPRDGHARGATTAEAAAIVFASLAGVAFAAVLVRLHEAIGEHAGRASALAAVRVRVERRERHKLADALHDGPVQQISSALRELAPASRGESARLVRARRRARRRLRL